MKEKSLYILCEYGLSVLTVKKLALYGFTYNDLLNDIDELKILDNTNIIGKRHIRRALRLSMQKETNETMYQLIEYGLSEPFIKHLIHCKINTLSSFEKITSDKLRRLKLNTSHIQ